MTKINTARLVGTLLVILGATLAFGEVAGGIVAIVFGWANL